MARARPRALGLRVESFDCTSSATYLDLIMPMVGKYTPHTHSKRKKNIMVV
jgi:hypothetical protein